MPSPRDSLAQLIQRCQALGLPATVQRRAILEVLLARDDHPTADDVAAALDERLGVSRATVYRTLETLVVHGLIERVGHPGAATRYDIRTDRHHHLVCDACGEITDFEEPGLDALSLPDFARSGFRVRDYSVQVRGLCRRCSRAPTTKPRIHKEPR